MPSSVEVGGIRMSVTTTSGSCTSTAVMSWGRSPHSATTTRTTTRAAYLLPRRPPTARATWSYSCRPSRDPTGREFVVTTHGDRFDAALIEVIADGAQRIRCVDGETESSVP